LKKGYWRSYMGHGAAGAGLEAKPTLAITTVSGIVKPKFSAKPWGWWMKNGN